MSPNPTPRSRKELETQIIAKAKKDEVFRQELLRQPTETICKEMGLKYVPNGPKFRVLEETPDTFYLVLPMKREQAAAVEAGALSDAELETVAGGALAKTTLLKPCEHD